MSASDAMENALLLLLFNNTNIANLGDSTGLRGSSSAGSLYIALHTADPTDAGDQTSSEATYAGYARVAVARSSGGWTISGTSPTEATNAAAVNFPLCTGTPNTVTYFSVGFASSGASVILASGALTNSLLIEPGDTPNFAIGALVATCD
jgi:hypothetical protein